MTKEVLTLEIPNSTKDITGNRYGRLTVLSYAGSIPSYMGSQSRVSAWNCQCDCGKTLTSITSRLKNGNTKSCGCLFSDVIKVVSVTHGKARSPTYRSWSNMWARCTNKKLKEYKHYGGRGISVCDEWRDFAVFLSDMGEKPLNHSIDRIDNDKDYSPDNCKWSNQLEQTRNRRVTVQFDGQPLADIAEQANVNYHTLYSRLRKYGTPFPEHLTKESSHA